MDHIPRHEPREGEEVPGEKPWGICLESHPLLEDVRCQRLQGHPGRHGAEVETRSAEIYLEWEAEAGSAAGTGMGSGPGQGPGPGVAQGA